MDHSTVEPFTSYAYTLEQVLSLICSHTIWISVTSLNRELWWVFLDYIYCKNIVMSRQTNAIPGEAAYFPNALSVVKQSSIQLYCVVPSPLSFKPNKDQKDSEQLWTSFSKITHHPFTFFPKLLVAVSENKFPKEAFSISATDDAANAVEEQEDVDECQLYQGQLCQHTCTKIWDSYRCGCHQGYILQQDGHSCAPGTRSPQSVDSKTKTLCCLG